MSVALIRRPDVNQHTTVGDLARDIGERIGREVPPRVISDLFYKRVLSDERCPILGGRRLIPRDYIPEVERVLKDRGLGLPENREA